MKQCYCSPIEPPPTERTGLCMLPCTSQQTLGATTPSLPTNIVGFRGFDSSITLCLTGDISRLVGDFPESLSQAMWLGVMLVGRLGVLALTLFVRHGLIAFTQCLSLPGKYKLLRLSPRLRQTCIRQVVLVLVWLLILLECRGVAGPLRWFSSFVCIIVFIYLVKWLPLKTITTLPTGLEQTITRMLVLEY